MTMDKQESHSLISSPITVDMLIVGNGGTAVQVGQLFDLLNEYRDCFALDLDELGTTNISKMHVQLQDNIPIPYKPYRLPYTERLVVRDLINDLMNAGKVRESNSSFASPIILVKKKTANIAFAKITAI